MWLSLKTSVSIWLVLGLFFAYHPKIYTEEMKCNQPVDVVILLDGSDSISDNDWVRSKNFVKELIGSFDIGLNTIHIGIIVYSSNIGDVIGLKKFHSKETLKFLANRLHHPKDGTDTAAGIRKVTEMMEAESRPNAARVAIVITDGRSKHPIQTTQEALKAKSAGIVMLTVGVGHAISRAELSQIATSEREMFDVSNFSGLQGIVGILRKLLCKNACLVTQKDSTFAMRDHCAGYWSCHYGRAEAKCCQRNHRYVQGKGCQPDGSCNQLCPHFKNTVENDKSECELLTDEDNPSSYIQIVPGIGPISRPCAPGSAFDKSMCSCAKVSKSWKPHVECKPSVSYNFNEDFADQSGNNVFAGYERVIITENGSAKFSDGSRINIWRFANVEFGEKLLLKLRFLTYNYGAVEQPIVTNCYGEYGEGPSIAITTVEQSITIKIKTEFGETGILRFFQVPGFNNVTMVYDGQHVIAKVNGKIKSTALIGNIERRQAGLLIGDCDGQHSFHGEIDYFAVYMCLPDEDVFQRVAPTKGRDIA
ncbi:matrilin-3-like isoform X4 [Octopus sinensis]|uniref:Matrilin-3-like isoform X4 n=1 Tax=Octopus sinensis TaxID=2607531 RepID=A0A7E6F020_9MOLL|nr:matrilin-3-like isoform X4 [Octopus sinensis]